jgi:hypothetical protein
MAWSKDLVAKMHEANKARGLADEFLYVNDCGDYQKPYEGIVRVDA